MEFPPSGACSAFRRGPLGTLGGAGNDTHVGGGRGDVLIDGEGQDLLFM